MLQCFSKGYHIISFAHTLSPFHSVQHLVQCLQDVLGGGDGDAWSLVLDEDGLDLAVLDDGGVAGRAVVAEEATSIEGLERGRLASFETSKWKKHRAVRRMFSESAYASRFATHHASSGGEVTGVISQEVHDWVLLGNTELLLPCLDDESVVDSNNVDALDTLGRELLSALNVAWDLGGAWRSEGTGDTEDDVLACEGGEVDLEISLATDARTHSSPRLTVPV